MRLLGATYHFLALNPISYDEAIQKHYKAVGCSECYHTGYKGRKAIYEIIPITKELVQKIQNKELEVDEYLIKHKIKTLQMNALNLVEQGITSIEEVYPLLAH